MCCCFYFHSLKSIMATIKFIISHPRRFDKSASKQNGVIQNRRMSKQQININAWREILARIFEDFEVQYNVSPAWLINPETNRPLKLNLLYPEIGVAIRILGLRGREQKAPTSLTEELQQKQRERARHDLCEAHGFSLANVDLRAEKPQDVFIELEMALSKANLRTQKGSDLSETQSSNLSERISQARSRLSDLNRKIKNNQALNPYYDLWLDREFAATQPDSTAPPATKLTLSEGMIIEHVHFGIGEIESVKPSGDDQIVTINFGDEGERQFMASLLSDKLALE
jgi:hypothetical protein